MRHLLLTGLLLGGLAGVASPGEPGTDILNTHSFWRCHLTLRPPLYGTAADAKPDPKEIPKLWRVGPTMPVTQPWSPLPPADWARPEFDDAGWWRQPGPFPGSQWRMYGPYGGNHSVGMALLCVRGRFTVTDPARVKELVLSVSYRGGVVVYLNGEEFLRKHMPPGKIGFETLAEDYPLEASLGLKSHMKGEAARKWEAIKVRKASSVQVPVKLLRKGTNVLAIEVHRTAVLPAARLQGHYSGHNLRRLKPNKWNRCALVDVSLRSPGLSGLIPNITRPRGVQVWNANLLTDVLNVDYGDPNEKLHPIRIVGTRNGVFAGQVVVSSDQAIKGVKAEVSDLVREPGEGRIPRSLATVYYVLLDEQVSNVNFRYPTGTGKYWYGPGRHMRRARTLLETPPTEVKVTGDRSLRAGYPYVFGAVLPIWISVRIPREARPGTYAGTLRVSAQGLNEVKVAVRVKVCPWVLPRPQDFATMTDFIQSPESVAMYYNVPLWSERHFQLMGKTFEFLGEVGNRTVYVPAVTPTHLGNSGTMVRWVEKGQGRYEYDFGIVDKYLDLAEKHQGRPRIVCLYVWDYYLGGRAAAGAWALTEYKKDGYPAKKNTVGVSKLDRATGKVETIRVPAYGSKEAKKLWGPFAEALRAFMKKRGLEGALMLGMAGDIHPSKEYVAFWKDILPQAEWVVQGHGRADHLYGVPVGYCASVFGCSYAVTDPEIKRLYGWKRPNVTTLFPRVLKYGCRSILFIRLLGEWNVSGNQNGVGRVPADFFRVLGSGRRKRRLAGRDPECSWGNAGLVDSWLAPGAGGAIPTADFVLLREGVQECEARIFIEKALSEEAKRAKLGAQMAERLQKLLDERTRYALWVFDIRYLNHNTGGCMLGEGPLDLSWFAGSGWEERAERLYSAAAEVARALGVQKPSVLATPTPKPMEKPTPGRPPAPAAEQGAAEKRAPTRPSAPSEPTLDQVCRGWWSLAMSYKRAGHKDKAREYLRKIIDAYPRSEYAAEARKEMAGLR